eukprot:3034640-Prymnesium_polylepis.1
MVLNVAIGQQLLKVNVHRRRRIALPNGAGDHVTPSPRVRRARLHLRRSVARLDSLRWCIEIEHVPGQPRPVPLDPLCDADCVARVCALVQPEAVVAHARPTGSLSRVVHTSICSGRQPAALTVFTCLHPQAADQKAVSLLARRLVLVVYGTSPLRHATGCGRKVRGV